MLERKQEIHRQCANGIKNIAGLSLAEAPDYARNNHWLNLVRIDAQTYGQDREMLMKRLEQNGIQSRPVWPLNHKQKPYHKCQSYKIEKAEELVKNSLCLPSITNLTDQDIRRLLNCVESRYHN